MIANEEDENNEGDWRIERRNPKFWNWWVENMSPKIGKFCQEGLDLYFDSSMYYVFHRTLWFDNVFVWVDCGEIMGSV